MRSEFSQRLQFLREHKKPIKSRSDTADFIGISRSSLRKYELGLSVPSLDVAALLADYYGVTIDYLYYGK